MIAHIRPPEAPERSPQMRRARHLVAVALLQKRSRPAGDLSPIRVWKAWLITAWVVVVTGVYAAYMLGLL